MGAFFECSSRMNGKPSSPVLRGLGASNGARPLDHQVSDAPFRCRQLGTKIGSFLNPENPSRVARSLKDLQGTFLKGFRNPVCNILVKVKNLRSALEQIRGSVAGLVVHPSGRVREIDSPTETGQFHRTEAP